LKRRCNPNCRPHSPDPNYVFTAFNAFESQIEVYTSDGHNNVDEVNEVQDERHRVMMEDMRFAVKGMGESGMVRFRVDERIGCIEVG
jgi:hypothetical protein